MLGPPHEPALLAVPFQRRHLDPTAVLEVFHAVLADPDDRLNFVGVDQGQASRAGRVPPALDQLLDLVFAPAQRRDEHAMCVRFTELELKPDLVLDGDARGLAVVPDVLGEGIEIAAHLPVKGRLTVHQLQYEGMGRWILLERPQQDGRLLFGVLPAASLARATLGAARSWTTVLVVGLSLALLVGLEEIIKVVTTTIL